MEEYIKNHNNNFDEMRKEIIGYLEKTYNNGEVKPPINKDDVKPVIIQDVISKIKEILNSKEYVGHQIIMDETDDLNPFIGAWEEFEKNTI